MAMVTLDFKQSDEPVCTVLLFPHIQINIDMYITLMILQYPLNYPVTTSALYYSSKTQMLIVPHYLETTLTLSYRMAVSILFPECKALFSGVNFSVKQRKQRRR